MKCPRVHDFKINECEFSRSGWQIIPTRIMILTEINYQITEYVCKNPHWYNVSLSQYHGVKITTNTGVFDALELDIIWRFISVTRIGCYALLC